MNTPDKKDGRTKEELDRIESDISNKARLMFKDDDWGAGVNPGRGRTFSPDHEETVGICATCESYEYAEDHLHQIVHARCSAFRRQLGRSRIADCSGYRERGRLSLSAMFAMATLIDGKPDKKSGFL